MNNYLPKIYANRWNRNSSRQKNLDSENRSRAWDFLVNKVFSKYISENDTVLDLGAGQGEFINRITCARKIAVDVDSSNNNKFGPDVEFLNIDVRDLSAVTNKSIDVVFTSNLFEHLDNAATLINLLEQIYIKLSDNNSKILIMIPNIKKTGMKFFDFIDHTLPLSDASMIEALEIAGFQIQFCSPGFFPYTARGAKWVYPKWFFRFYLSIPLKNRLLAGQMFLVAVPKPAS